MLNALARVQEGTKKECGLHSGNIADVSNGAEDAERDLWPQGPVEALSKDQLQQLADGPRDKATIVVLYAPWCQYSKVTLFLRPLLLACLIPRGMKLERDLHACSDMTAPAQPARDVCVVDFSCLVYVVYWRLSSDRCLAHCHGFAALGARHTQFITAVAVCLSMCWVARL